MSSRHDDAISNRYEFVCLYDVENGNPNGDPIASNSPRVDPTTGHGIVTDVCIKRKIRDYMRMFYGNQRGFDIYVRHGASLSRQDQKGFDAAKSAGSKGEKSAAFREAMCSEYFDVRAFGAMITSAIKDPSLSREAGQIRGPVQLTFGRSVDPIQPQEVWITRMGISSKPSEGKGAGLGRKSIVPYGLYRQEGYISANLARKVTGFSEDDLEAFWDALTHMFDDDRSSARGKMALRTLVVFRHDSPYGNEFAHNLFERVNVLRKNKDAAPRSYADYAVSLNDTDMPDGVTVEKRVWDSMLS